MVRGGVRPAELSSQDIVNDVGFFDAGEFGVETAEWIGEARVIDAQDVQHRGVQVAEFNVTCGNGWSLSRPQKPGQV
jgi:hypothetical protein